MPNEPFFAVEDGRYIPLKMARGVWNNGQSLHGRVVVGLLGHEIERLHGGPDYMPARLTVDMYRMPDLSPLTVETRAVRDGYRIKVIDAELFSGGTSVARASSQLLRKTENPAVELWRPPVWDAPPPNSIPTDPDMAWSERWNVRPISPGGFRGDGPRRIWMSEVRDLVAGRPLTPFTRIVVSADIASPIANGGREGLAYINTDLTIYLHREPIGEWIGYGAVDHGSTAGVATGVCSIHDVQGAIGTAICTGLAQGELMVRQREKGEQVIT